MPRLRANGYEFYLFDHKGRSPHIHIYNIPELKSLAPEYRRLYKRSFLEKYVGQKLVREKVVDSSLCNEGLIAMEFKPHWKHGTTKDLVLASLKYSDAGTNSTSLSSLHTNKFEHELFLKAVENYEQNKELNDKIEYKKGSGNWLCNWLLRQPRYLHQMDLIIFKNVAIALYNEDRDINSYCEALRIKDNKHHPESEIKSWFKWAKENNKKGFNKAEINQFFDLYPDLKR